MRWKTKRDFPQVFEEFARNRNNERDVTYLMLLMSLNHVLETRNGKSKCPIAWWSVGVENAIVLQYTAME